MSTQGEIAIEYEIDALDCFVSVGGDWDLFAEMNGAPQLAADTMLGKRLWAFLSGADIESLYRILTTRVRQSKRAINFDFRCDSPNKRRLFHLIVTPLPDNCLRFYSILLKEEERPSVTLFDPAAPRNADILKVCSVCKKVDCTDGWIEVEDAVKHRHLLENEPTADLA